LTKVAHSGGMIIQHFEFETHARAVPVYRGETYFGFFRREALAHQVGIREAAPYRPKAEEQVRSRTFHYPRAAVFPGEPLRMIDRVEAFIPDGGPHGLGFISGTKRVDPSAWFFAAHFVQDPVVPGSLGLESLQQLLTVVAVERWGPDVGECAIETPEPGEQHHWTYRGQVVPGDGLMTTQAVVTAVDDRRHRLRADGYLEVDGRVIYRMSGFTLKLT
jgi:3-hydroxymyristoyl/3-hydroxydecanoyl-(acyl carrier protein) dehydratase